MPGVRSRTPLLAVLVALACQGDFAPPALLSPRDPANGALPPTPAISRLEASCDGNEPRIELVWTVADATGLTGFQVYRSPALDEDPGLLVASVPADRRQFTDGARPGLPGLQSGVEYRYRVRALGAGGLPGLRSQPAALVAPPCP